MKLHPLSVPYRLVQQGIGIVVALVFIAAPSAGAAVGFAGGAATAAIIALGLAAVLTYSVAYYRRFEYELTDDTFDIQSGVLARREREIPLRRIQNVDISQNVVQRALGMAEVRLETAGGSSSEAQLRYVATDEADRLQTEISRLSRSQDGEAAAEAERFDTVFSINPRELGVLALVSTDFRLASILFFGASVFGPSAASAMDPEVVWGPESIVSAVLGPLAGIGAVLLFGLASGLLNAARYYGFELRRGDEELRYERGLLQRYSGTIPLSKVQNLTIRENALARSLGYASLSIETAGHTPGSGESDGSQSAIPLAKRERVDALATSIEPWGDAEFQRPPKRARERYAARYLTVLLALAGVLYGAAQVVDVRLYWWAVLALLPVVPVAAHLKWKQRGYAIGDDHVVTRNGFWVRQTKVVPYHRVQTVFTSETVFQRRRRLGTVTIDTAGSQSFAGNDAQAVDVDASTVEELRETVADRLHTALVRRARETRAERSLSDRTDRPDREPGTPAD